MGLSRDITLCPKCGRFNDEEADRCIYCKNMLRAEDIRILVPGTTIGQGQYRILSYTGRSRHSLTYRARDKAGTEVKVWEYYPEGTASRIASTSFVAPVLNTESVYDEGKRTFVEEGKVLSRLADIPGAVSLSTVFEDNGTAYRIEKTVNGQNLDSIVGGKKLSFQEAVKIMQPVLETLSRLHRTEFLHRNITPSSVVFSGGLYLLTDFGSACRIPKVYAADRTEKQYYSETVSDQSPYTAPEQIFPGAPEGRWTDVYGAAALLYRLLTGKDPVDAESRQKGMHLSSPKEAGARVTDLQSSAVMQGLSMDTAGRYDTIEAFRNALDRAGQAVPVPDPIPAPSPGNPNLPVYFAAGLAAAVCLFLFLLFSGRMPFGSNGSKTDKTGAYAAADARVNKAGLLKLVTWKGSTYGFYDMEKIRTGDYDDMEAFASGMGAYPAVIDGYEENIFLYNQTLSAGAESAYFGYHSPEEGAVWVWPEEQESAFFQWAKNEPASGGSGGEKYARFTPYYMNGRWESSALDMQYPLILEWDQALDGAEKLTGTQNIYDTSTFTYGQSAYGIYSMLGYGLNTVRDSGVDNSSVEFDYILDFCRVRGGYLAVINDADENNFLFNKVMESGEDSAFFGYTDEGEEGDWEWVDRDSSYENWSPGQPNDGVGTVDGDIKMGEDYAQFYHRTRNGTWNDSMIHINTRAFIVEWDE